MTNPEQGDLTMTGIRLAATVTITFKDDDDLNDLDPDDAATAFRASLMDDLRTIYDKVESIAVGAAGVGAVYLGDEVLATCADLVEAALEDLATFDMDQDTRPPREVVQAIRVATERYRRAVKAIEAARSAA